MVNHLVKFSSLILLIAAVSATTTFVIQHQTNKSRPSSAQWIEETELTTDQMRSMEPHEKAMKRELDSLQIVLAKERLALCMLIREERPSADQLQKYTQRISQLESAQQEVVVRHLTFMAQLLNTAQKDRFFSSMMRDICMGCRNNACKPGTPCMCGHCGENSMKTHAS